jgi:hypothetical protein
VLIKEAQTALFGAIGEEGGEWEEAKGKTGGAMRVGRRGDLGEGGMYI